MIRVYKRKLNLDMRDAVMVAGPFYLKCLFLEEYVHTLEVVLDYILLLVHQVAALSTDQLHLISHL